MIVRHFHLDYFFELLPRVYSLAFDNLSFAFSKSVNHKEFGEFLVFIIGLLWILLSILTLFYFNFTQRAGFSSYGEQAVVLEEKRGDASSFLLTFVVPLIIDDLSCPQFYLSYFLLIMIICILLYRSNLYYQSPILSLLGYKVFVFKIKNPYNVKVFSPQKNYIGVTKKRLINENSAIVWKYISDDVFLVYNE